MTKQHLSKGESSREGREKKNDSATEKNRKKTLSSNSTKCPTKTQVSSFLKSVDRNDVEFLKSLTLEQLMEEFELKDFPLLLKFLKATSVTKKKKKVSLPPSCSSDGKLTRSSCFPKKDEANSITQQLLAVLGASAGNMKPKCPKERERSKKRVATLPSSVTSSDNDEKKSMTPQMLTVLAEMTRRAKQQSTKEREQSKKRVEASPLSVNSSDGKQTNSMTPQMLAVLATRSKKATKKSTKEKEGSEKATNKSTKEKEGSEKATKKSTKEQEGSKKATKKSTEEKEGSKKATKSTKEKEGSKKATKSTKEDEGNNQTNSMTPQMLAVLAARANRKETREKKTKDASKTTKKNKEQELVVPKKAINSHDQELQTEEEPPFILKINSEIETIFTHFLKLEKQQAAIDGEDKISIALRQSYDIEIQKYRKILNEKLLTLNPDFRDDEQSIVDIVKEVKYDKGVQSNETK